MGNSQAVGEGEDIQFDIEPDYIDIAGVDISIDDTGKIFTINRAGLYHIEWSLNLKSTSPLTLIGLMENGRPSSPLTNYATAGNYSSGALINVKEGDVPYTLSLHNFGGAIEIENPIQYGNSSASIRILRFADGEKLVR